jgi:hypothetical protein
VAIELDDIEDVADFELADVITPRDPEPPPFAVGSELRPRVVIQDTPSDLDVELIAYLLDIDPPPTPVAPAPTSDDDSIDESPTPRFRR